jgi:hypothetical protein
MVPLRLAARGIGPQIANHIRGSIGAARVSQMPHDNLNRIAYFNVLF